MSNRSDVVPQERGSTRTPKVVAWVGILAALSVLFFPVAPPDVNCRPNELSVWLSASSAGSGSVHYDREAGWNEPAAVQPLNGGSEAKEYRFGLPAGRIIRLRLALAVGGGKLTVERARIVTNEGREVYRFRPEDFLPDSAQQTLVWRGDALIVQAEPTVHAVVVLQPSRALLLPNDSPECRTVASRIIAVERGLAVLLLLVGGAMVAGLVRRAAASGASIWRRTAIAVSYAAICVLFARRPDYFANPQFWMEDARVFFVQQASDGARAFMVPHGGYLHLWPRLIAWGAAWLPVMWAPAIYNAGALVIVLVAIVWAMSPRVGLPLSAACALAIVLVPNCDEVIFNLTNAQWFGALALLLVAISAPPENAPQLAAELTTIVVLGLTGPFAVFLLPLFVVRAMLARRNRPQVWSTAVVVGLIAVAQYWVYRHSPDSAGVAMLMDPLKALAATGYRTGAQLLNVLPSAAHGSVVPVGLWGAAFWLALWLALPIAHGHLRMRVMLGLAAVVLIAGGLLRYRAFLDILFNPIHAQRYFFVPLVVTVWLLLAGCARSDRWRWLAAGVLAVVVVRNATSFRIHANMDLHWPEYARHIERGERTEFPINPRPWTALYPGRKTD